MIRKRGTNRWQIRVDLGRDPVTGKRTQAYHSFAGTKREAEAEERRLLRERDTGITVRPERMTVSVYLDRWLADVRSRVRTTTYDRYKSICDLHLVPTLGMLPLSKLRPLHLQDLYATKLGEEGRADKKGALSHTSVLHIHRVAHEALSAAVRWQLIGVNPADAARPPRQNRTEMNVLSEEDTKALLEKARGTVLYYPIITAVTTGLRRGELLGLRWSDVDLEGGTVSVRQTLQRSSGGLTFNPPKTTKGRRTVVLPPVTVKALKEHRAAQAEMRLERGSEWEDHDLVFCGSDGAPWHPEALSTRFRDFCRGTKYDVRWHDLRHSHATHLFRAGVHPKMASERLGHSTVGITLDLYTHVVEGMDRDAAERIDERLRQAGIG